MRVSFEVPNDIMDEVRLYRSGRLSIDHSYPADAKRRLAEWGLITPDHKRLTPAGVSATKVINEWVYATSPCQTLMEGKRIKLDPAGRKVLEKLVAAGGKIVPSQAFDQDLSMLRAYVSRIRKEFRAVGVKSQVKNSHGVGYYFVPAKEPA